MVFSEELRIKLFGVNQKNYDNNSIRNKEKKSIL